MIASESNGGDEVFEEETNSPQNRDPVILREQILLQLKKIIDPDLFQDIVSLGFIKDLCINYDDGEVSFILELTTPACPVKDEFVQQADMLLKELGWITHVNITMSSRKAQPMPGYAHENLTDVAAVLCVASCKGGVGKSSIAVNLAFMLSNLGAKVGIVDADVYGPSLPDLIPMANADIVFHSYEAEENSKRNTTDNAQIEYENPEMLASTGTHTSAKQKRNFVATGKGALLPLMHKGVKLMSAGYLKSTTQYAAIRGPIASNLAFQLVANTMWGALDYLIIDMPPGTGDVHLTLAQGVKITAAIMITTPQQLSLSDVEKGILMYNKLNIPTLAIIENMSYFECPTCCIKYEIFNHNAKIVNNTANGKIDKNVIMDDTTDCQEERRSSNRIINKESLAAIRPGTGVKMTGHKETANLMNNSSSNCLTSYENITAQPACPTVGGLDDIDNGYSNTKRLAEQFGIKHHFQLPLHNDLARVQFVKQTDKVSSLTSKAIDDGTCKVKEYLYPFVVAYNTNHHIWRRLKTLAEMVVRELSTLRFADDRAPDVSTTVNGMLQVITKSKDEKSIENVLMAPLRYVRLSCRCAECIDEFTGDSKIQHRKIPIDIHIKQLQQSGTYAVSIDWSDGHHSLMSFSLLENLCTLYRTGVSKQKGKAVDPNPVMGCESLEQAQW